MLYWGDPLPVGGLLRLALPLDTVSLKFGALEMGEVANRPRRVTPTEYPVLVNDFVSSLSCLVSYLDSTEHTGLQVPVKPSLRKLADVLLLSCPGLPPDLGLVGISVQMRPEQAHPQVEARARNRHTANFSQHGHRWVHGPERASNSLLEHNLRVAKPWKCRLSLHDWEVRENPGNPRSLRSVSAL